MLNSFRKDFAVLDEQIEAIDHQITQYIEELKTFEELPVSMWRTISSAKVSVDKLRQKVDREFKGERRFPAASVLLRINRYLIKEAGKSEVNVAIINSGKGYLPQSLMEIIFKIYVLLVQESIIRFKTESFLDRKKSNRFRSNSVVFRLTEEENNTVRFEFIDDGPVHSSFNSRVFQFVRKLVASKSGKCKISAFEDYGLHFRCEMPVPASRLAAKIFYADDLKIALHAGAVERVFKFDIENIDLRTNSFFYKNDLIPLCVLRRERGVSAASDDDIQRLHQIDNAAVSVVSVADVRFALLSEFVPSETKIRECDAEHYFRNESWFRNVGVVVSQNEPEIVPFLYGSEFFGVFKGSA